MVNATANVIYKQPLFKVRPLRLQLPVLKPLAQLTGVCARVCVRPDGLWRPHQGLCEERCDLGRLRRRCRRPHESVCGKPVRRGARSLQLHNPEHTVRYHRGQHVHTPLRNLSGRLQGQLFAELRHICAFTEQVLLNHREQNGTSVPPREPHCREDNRARE
jgi:hypothetical protein